MKISTKGRYALRLMLDIATYNKTGKPINIKDISKRQELSEKYLEQIISVLNKGGLVSSIRGSHGGYLLRKNPNEITVGMIFRLTEGDLAPVSCVSDDNNHCDRKNTCVTIHVYEQLNEAIRNVVDNITLEDLLNKQENTSNNYII